jgi:hypothetical protein
LQNLPTLRTVSSQQERSSARPGTASFTPEQKREIFKGMVVAALDAGFLRYSRRQELLRSASCLGIGEFEACLLIAEAQFRSGEIDPVQMDDLAGLAFEPLAHHASASSRITLALVLAAFIDLVIVLWLF